MSKNTYSDEPTPPRRNVTGDRDERASSETFDGTVFREFVDLLGPAQARRWLGVFQDGLRDEFSDGVDTAPDMLGSRANIHHFCARSGLIGFTGLHAACLEYLECGARGGDIAVAYGQVRDQAKRAISELERQNAVLG